MGISNGFIFVCSIIIFLVAVYEVQCNGDDMGCMDGMLPGDERYYQPCAKCTCKNGGMACVTCPPNLQPNAPAGCSLQRRPGNYPDCCDKDVICP